MKFIPVMLVMFFIFSGVCPAMGADQNVYPDLEISESRLKETVETLTLIRPYRNSENPGSLRKAAAYIRQRFSECDLKTEEQEFEAEGNRYVNIIATLGPEKAERIIIGAHYDVCGEQPGADDNASGIAGLLEIARLLSVSGRKFKYRYDFVAYALEEPPFFGTKQMGSYIHAKSLRKAKARVKGMICLESIGYFSDQEGSQSYPLGIMKWFYPRTGNYIAVVGNLRSGPFLREIKKHMGAASLPIQSLNSPAWLPGVDFSDHRNYWACRYPAVMITDTALYRNPHYHESTDTLDTLNFPKIKEVVKGVFYALWK